MNALLIALIAAALAGMLGIGVWASSRQKTAADFFVGGRRFGLLSTSATQIATSIGGGVMLAQVGIGYRWGFSVLVYSSIAAPLGVFLLARFLARWLRSQDFYSTTDWMCHQYGETRLLRGLTAFVVSLYAVAAWVAQPIAAAKILNVLTGLPLEWGILLCAVVVIVYTMTGGIIAVAYTDVAQLALMFLAIFVLLPVVMAEAGGIGQVLESVPSENLTLSAAGDDVLLGWFFAVLPAQIVKQTLHQRIFGARTEAIAVQGLYNLSIASCLTGVWAALMGMAIFSLNPGLEDQELATIWAVQEILHPVVAAIALAALVAAVVSSADSALHSASTSLTRDIYQMVFRPAATDKEIVRVSKVCVTSVGAAGIVIGIYSPQVLDAIVLGYSLTAAGLFFPLVLGRFWRGATRAGAIAGIVAGVAFTVTFKLVDGLGESIPAVAAGLLASAAAMVAVSGLTATGERRPDAASR